MTSGDWSLDRIWSETTEGFQRPPFGLWQGAQCIKERINVIVTCVPCSTEHGEPYAPINVEPQDGGGEAGYPRRI